MNQDDTTPDIKLPDNENPGPLPPRPQETWTVTTYQEGDGYGYRLWAYDENGGPIFLEPSPPAYDSHFNADRGGDRRGRELGRVFSRERE